MRQCARENVEGFSPGCGIEGRSFAHHWKQDPEEPAIANLMSAKEAAYYDTIAVPLRPAAIQVELHMLLGELSLEVRYHKWFIMRSFEKTEDECFEFDDYVWIS